MFAGLIGLLAPKLGATVSKFVVYGGVVLLLVGALLWWGHTKYQAGVRDTDARWEEAGRVLQRRAVESATKADDAAARRAAVHDQEVAAERERIQHAEENNSSTFDVIFGPGGL